jgi:hypothetical protein
MAEEKEQGNIRQEYNNATVGLNMDQSVNQIKPGTLTYALNASVENFDASSVNYQNEPGNELCLTFPNEFVLIGSHFIQEKNKHLYFLTNPNTGDSEIGFMDNNDCQYQKLVKAKCLNFNINYPIHKVVHKITNCTTEIYWTDGFNPRRYLDIDDVPKIIVPGTDLCDAEFLDELDCNQLKLQPNFNIPSLEIVDIATGGDLTAGTYQFAIQYSDSSSNPYTSYYSVTNPTPIANTQITTPNFNYQVGKSIIVRIDGLDATGQFQYFNLAVIKTVNNVSSVELVGTYFIDDIQKNITYTGQNQTQIRLTVNDIFEKFPFYELANDLTAVQDILVWDGLTSIDRINYQFIASQISLQWESWRIPATENYSDELNATNLRGYLRDEVYAFEIVFLLNNGKQTDGFHIPGRKQTINESISQPNVPNTNPDFIGEGTSAPYWKIYNTASIIGTSPEYSSNPSYKGPYKYGDFAYWESTETYPCNDDIWGDLAGQPIRHHKFPDVLVSPIFESAIFTTSQDMVMQNDAVFPIGVKIDIQQIRTLIQSSSLTNSQKDNIVGFKIIRGDRGTNKSIVAKGILRNVGEYEREEQSFYFPNYPYNDLNEDPFLNEQNNAYLGQAEAWLLTCTAIDSNTSSEEKPYALYSYTDINTNKLTTRKMYFGETYEFLSLTRPTFLSGEAYIGPANFDVYEVASEGFQGFHVDWDSPFTIDNTAFKNERVWLEGTTAGLLPIILPIFALTALSTFGWIIGAGVFIVGGIFINSRKILTVVDVGGTPREECDNSILNPCDDDITYIPNDGEAPLTIIDFTKSRRSSLKPNVEVAFNPLINDKLKYRQVFNSPETSFGQPFLGDVLKLESVIFGKGKAHFVAVRNNAKYRLLSKEAQEDALTSSANIAGITSSNFNATAMFTAYQAYLTIYINGITRKNYAYSFNSIANYDYWKPIDNNIGIKQRQIDYTQYLIPGVQSVGEEIVMNNFQRESSVFIKTIEDRDGVSVTPLLFPSDSPNMIEDGSSIVKDYSRFTISGSNVCPTPAKEQDIRVVSYYASMKNIFVNQWGQIYSYETVDTGFQKNIKENSTATIFGGDTFISRFTFKTKLPFFIDNRVNAPDDSDIFYDEIGNIAYPKYWHSARSILENYLAGGTTMSNIISYKAHNFDCPNDPSAIATTPGVAGTLRTFYDGYFYLFAYGVPNFYCESSYNTDLRQAFNNREGDFWPHVTTGIPDEWVQEDNVSIANDNTYTYNITFSKQNKENFFSHLPSDWTEQLCFTYFPFRAIYSDPQNQNADVRINNWLIYRATSIFDFPQNFGALTSLDGIQNKAVLARFENKSLLYNTMLTVNTSNPQAAYLGNDTLFKSSPPIDFAETDLGYVGSQNKFLLKIPQGQITIDAKRGQVFLISGNQAADLTAFGSGVNRFFTDHLAFEILRYFPSVPTDNHFNGIGLHGVYDSKFDRVILTKIDYIPLSKDVKYNKETNEFYIETIINNVSINTRIYLTDTDYFCNKSWTISFNFNTKSWISFHSYIPNWYIGDNNFFYSGINGCCSDTDVDFLAIAGDLNRIVPTTTTTSSSSTTTTSTTELPIFCELEAQGIITSCELDGTGVITVLPTTTTTTTLCIPFRFMATYELYSGYEITGELPVDTSVSFELLCESFPIIVSPVDKTLTNFTCVLEGESILEVGKVLYAADYLTTCSVVPDGWYYDFDSLVNFKTYHVVNGIITEILTCDCGTTTTTTTTIFIPECCGVVILSNDGMYLLDTLTGYTTSILNTPNFMAANSLAMTTKFLWNIDNTEFRQWDITLDPFTATYNREIAFPIGYVPGPITALNNDVLLCVDNANAPTSVDIVEMDITDVTGVSTLVFSIPDITIISNLLYTFENKLIFANEDLISGDTYISQYDYTTTTLELNINIGSTIVTSIFECDCAIFFIDDNNVTYNIRRESPYDITEVATIAIPVISVTQPNSCIPNNLETTTTSTSSTTTTTTTTI